LEKQSPDLKKINFKLSAQGQIKCQKSGKTLSPNNLETRQVTGKNLF